MDKFHTTVTVENICFSNHDTLRIVIEKTISQKKKEFNGFLDLLEYDLN